MTQEPPFAIQVELVEGCNLYCNFCALTGIRELKNKNYKFMIENTLHKLVTDIAKAGWNPRIEFAMHGEPTMHPDYVGMIKIAREHLPQCQLMMTSNGGGLLREPGVHANLVNLFNAGLNVFAFDAYEQLEIKTKVMGAIENATEFKVWLYPDNLDASPHSRWPKGSRNFIRIADISVAQRGTHAVLNNHAGVGGPPLAQPLTARCAKPFRELSIRWDGNVALCCNDFRGVYKIDNVHETDIVDLWNHPGFNSARKFLMQGNRGAINPCNVCDAKSYRVGLLPDKKGKVKMAEPTDIDKINVEHCSEGAPYTAAVAREWEKADAYN